MTAPQVASSDRMECREGSLIYRFDESFISFLWGRAQLDSLASYSCGTKTQPLCDPHTLCSSSDRLLKSLSRTLTPAHFFLLPFFSSVLPSMTLSTLFFSSSQMTHWHSPHFHAYFPTANSYPAILADMLSGALACIGFSWIASPACTELEMVMMDWLAKMIQLPEHFLFSHEGPGGGVIQGTASEATLVTLLAARNKTLATNPTTGSIDCPEILGRLVAYCSEQAHSSVQRASLLGAVKMRSLPTGPDLSLRGETLANAIQVDRENGFTPFFVVATLGTTSTCAFDNLEELGRVCVREGLWLHVDAAYAGSSFVCPEFRRFMKGIDLADSFNMNPHKWLLVNFDCSTLWIKDASHVVDSFNVNPVYLRHEMQGKVPDYRHWQIPLGRRFRSLKMWFVFRTYGQKGLQAYIRKHVALAKEFEQKVLSDSRFELFCPVELGLVCFRLKGSNEMNEQLNQLINANRKIHVTPTHVQDSFVLRFAVCAVSTESPDIEFAWQEILLHADSLL